MVFCSQEHKATRLRGKCEGYLGIKMKAKLMRSDPSNIFYACLVSRKKASGLSRKITSPQNFSLKIHEVPGSFIVGR